ncbi:MAG: peptide-methionine (S)-S-oxide reductase MsrA, partial [Candidatus Pelagibacterales bacterium]
TNSFSENLKKAYFAGGCFWCMEESFDKVKGVKVTTSGYSGGHVKNPTYKQVVQENTGHLESVEVVYDSNVITYTTLVDAYFKSIDPFDSEGQFCDKGYSYRSGILYQDLNQKKIIDRKILEIETKFKKKAFVILKKFNEFYKAENYHQDFYEKNFFRYLAYKKACKREERLNELWNN